MKNNYPFFTLIIALYFLSPFHSIITVLHFPGASVMTIDLHAKKIHHDQGALKFSLCCDIIPMDIMDTKECSICSFTAYVIAMCLTDLSSVESSDGGWGKC